MHGDMHYVFEVPYSARDKGGKPVSNASRTEAVAYMEAAIRECYRNILRSPSRLKSILGDDMPLKSEGENKSWDMAMMLDTGKLSTTQYERFTSYVAELIRDSIMKCMVWNPVLTMAVRALPNFATAYVLTVIRAVRLPTAASAASRNPAQGETATALQETIARAEVRTHNDQELPINADMLQHAGRAVVNFQKGETDKGYANLSALQASLRKSGADFPIELAAYVVKDVSGRLDEMTHLLRPTQEEITMERELRITARHLADEAFRRSEQIGESDRNTLTYLAKSERFAPDGDGWIALSDVESFCGGCADFMRKNNLRAVTVEAMANTLDREFDGWSSEQWEAAIDGMREAGVGVPDQEKSEAMVVEILSKSRAPKPSNGIEEYAIEYLTKAHKVRSKITGSLVSASRHAAGRAGMAGWANKMRADGGSHPFSFCLEKMRKHLGDDAAKKFCARVHIMAFGMTPSQKKAKEKGAFKSEILSVFSHSPTAGARIR